MPALSFSGETSKGPFWRQIILSLLLGYIVAFVTGVVIQRLNEVYFPEYTDLWRLLIWVIVFGVLFTLAFHDILKKLSVKENKTR